MIYSLPAHTNKNAFQSFEILPLHMLTLQLWNICFNLKYKKIIGIY